MPVGTGCALPFAPDVGLLLVSTTVSALVNAEGKTEEGGDALSVSDTFLDLHATILADDRLSLATRALILRVPAGAANRGELRHRYKEIADAGKIMNQAVFDHHGDQLLALFTKIQKEEDTTAPQVGLCRAWVAAQRLRPCSHVHCRCR